MAAPLRVAGSGEGEELSDTPAEALPPPPDVPVTLPVPEAVPHTVAVAMAVAVTEALGVKELLADAVPLTLVLGRAVPLGSGEADTAPLLVTVCEALGQPLLAGVAEMHRVGRGEELVEGVLDPDTVVEALPLGRGLLLLLGVSRPEALPRPLALSAGEPLPAAAVALTTGDAVVGAELLALREYVGQLLPEPCCREALGAEEALSLPLPPAAAVPVKAGLPVTVSTGVAVPGRAGVKELHAEPESVSWGGVMEAGALGEATGEAEGSTVSREVALPVLAAVSSGVGEVLGEAVAAAVPVGGAGVPVEVKDTVVLALREPSLGEGLPATVALPAAEAVRAPLCVAAGAVSVAPAEPVAAAAGEPVAPTPGEAVPETDGLSTGEEEPSLPDVPLMLTLA